jgi:hypothetical protein
MGQLAKKDIEREHRKFMLNWFPKLIERGNIILANIGNHANVIETDYEVLEAMYRSYYMGYLPDFVPAWQPPIREKKGQNVTETNLFNQECHTPSDGTNIAMAVTEPKTKEQ